MTGKNSESKLELVLLFPPHNFAAGALDTPCTSLKRTSSQHGMHPTRRHNKERQLCALGKQRLPSKVKKEERGVWASIVPAGTEMSVLGLLAAMVVGDITPLYSLI